MTSSTPCSRAIARLLLGGDGAEDARAQHLGHLDDQPAGAAGRGMHQAGVAAL